ncbi:MAG: 3-hydroxy-3-methylglutaryl Coenzyme A reductase [Microgenomates bacterium 39_7]|nr:MAG: 3-hydroxy-3-methylglutaryl Coenzyme A reductase [Microgenomates bacterium 39_7]
MILTTFCDYINEPTKFGCDFFCYFDKLIDILRMCLKKSMSNLKDKNKNNLVSEKMKLAQEAVGAHKDGAHKDLDDLLDVWSFDPQVVGSKNCENLIGSIEVPVGVAGPVESQLTMIDSSDQVFESEKTKFFLPLATTEGALVASINRGCKAIRLANNCSVQIRKIGMTRAPVFGFPSQGDAARFISWIKNPETQKKIKKVSEKTSDHLTYLGCSSWQVGRNVYLRFRFDSDQAMGMNMVTIAVNRLWQDLLNKQSGISLISISSNMCCDKKCSSINKLLGRGYETNLEVILSAEIIQDVLKTTTQQLFQTYYFKNVVGSNLAGSMSQNMHAANAVAAIFLATGQDMAHVVESSQADLIMQQEEEGGIYLALRMPNINVGVVGGGTQLPAFVQARNLMIDEVRGELTSEQLAAATALAVLAGEISGLAALSVNQLAAAHQKLARGKQDKTLRALPQK